MTNLEIALKLREQIKKQWPHVSTILALYKNNTEGIFTERIQKMVGKLPDEVFYLHDDNRTGLDNPMLFETCYNDGWRPRATEIKSLPINTVLFATEDNLLGILK